jgi:hypothetical protein
VGSISGLGFLGGFLGEGRKERGICLFSGVETGNKCSLSQMREGEEKISDSQVLGYGRLDGDLMIVAQALKTQGL